MTVASETGHFIRQRMLMKSDFKEGLLGGLPICLGYLSVAFAFGIFAVSNGLSGATVVLISMTNVTSAGQLAGVPLLTGGGTLIELAVTQLVINLRYALMSISLSQRLDGSVRLLDRLLVAFVNTDEVFAVASSRGKPCSRFYLFGLILLPYLGWSLGTLLGVIAGNVLPALVVTALGIAIYGMFVAIVIPEMKRSKSTSLCVAVAVALSCAFTLIPGLNRISSGFVIILSSVGAAALLAALAPIPEEEEAAHG